MSTHPCPGVDGLSRTFEPHNGPILREDGSWIAARGVVLREISVGRAATVAARALATRDVAPGIVLCNRAFSEGL
jgi:putative colanic acid biosynthesis acetyltransferase WcaF